jgi:hypothetical protein
VQEALLSVTYELLKKMQFRHNSRQLLELNTTPLDDNRHSGISVHCLRHFCFFVFYSFKVLKK